MRYCNQCGSEVIKKVPEGDNRLRHVCVSIAFTTIKYTLEFFLQDQRNKQFRLHTGDIINQDDGSYVFRAGA